MKKSTETKIHKAAKDLAKKKLERFISELTTDTAAKSVIQILSNEQMADGLIKLMMCFSMMDYLAKKRKGIVLPLEYDHYYEASCEIAYQIEVAKIVMPKKQTTK